MHQPQASSVVIEARPARERLLSAGNSQTKSIDNIAPTLGGLRAFRAGGWAAGTSLR